MAIRRYEISDFEWSIMLPLLPNKPRGVARVEDRKVLNGIYWRLRIGSPWADIPERYGPYTTCYNRFVQRRKLGVWDAIFEAVSKAYEGSVLWHATEVIKHILNDGKCFLMANGEAKRRFSHDHAR